MILDEIRRYYAGLDRSPKPRRYYFGRSPDDRREQWFFEAVEDEGRLIAIRQLTIAADGSRQAYSPEHLDDARGGLTDQPIDYEDQLQIITAKDFYAAWNDV